MASRRPQATISGVIDQLGAPTPDPLEADPRLLADLHATPNGLSTREAARRLQAYGPNEIVRRGGARWPRELLAQFTHPLPPPPPPPPPPAAAPPGPRRGRG